MNDIFDHLYNGEKPRQKILLDVLQERMNQIRKWGEQRHPDGVPATLEEVTKAKNDCAEAGNTTGALTWRQILDEEVAEAYYEIGADEAKLRAELVQVSAVAQAWIEDIDSRKK